MKLNTRTMMQRVPNILKWVSVPVLLIGSLFSFYATGYGPVVDLVVCLAALVLVQRAVQFKEYFWAAALVTVVVAFSPLGAIFKIFALMGLACMATLITLLSSFRTHTARAR